LIKEKADTEKEVTNFKEVEDLSKVDIGLTESDALLIVAQTRLGYAIDFQRLHVQQFTVRASVRANESVGNTQAVDNFKNILINIDRDIAHCLRSIKEIDSKYPGAKTKMQELPRR
jgi:hypothetical protein